MHSAMYSLRARRTITTITLAAEFHECPTKNTDTNHNGVLKQQHQKQIPKKDCKVGDVAEMCRTVYCASLWSTDTMASTHNSSVTLVAMGMGY